MTSGSRDKLTGIWQEFQNGLIKPSAFAAVTMVVAFIFAIAGSFWFFSEKTISGPMGKYIARSSLDANGFVTAEVLEMRNTKAGKPRLLILGASTVAQAMANEDALAKNIMDQGGGDWDVRLLVTPLQSPLDQFAIIENILTGVGTTSDLPTVIVLDMGLQRLGWTRKRHRTYDTKTRLGLRSEWADFELEGLGLEPQRRFGIYALDNIRFVILNGTEALLRLAVQKPAVKRTDTFSKNKAMVPENRPREILRDQVLQGQENAPAFLEMQSRLLERIRAFPQVKVLLIDSILSPDFLSSEIPQGAQTEMTGQIQEFADREGVEILPVIEAAKLLDSEFYDDLHVLRGPVQKRVRAEFADQFSAWAKGENLINEEN